MKLGFAVLYSTLVLYATKHLQLSVKEATTLLGVFFALVKRVREREIVLQTVMTSPVDLVL